MPDDLNDHGPNLIDLNPGHGTFPLPELLEHGLWSAMSANAKAVLGVLWNYHRKFPDACRPSRKTLAAEAGVCGPSVTKALKQLEAIGIVTVIVDPGPRTNTYRLQWRNLKVPTAKMTTKTDRSPFKMPTTDMVPEVSYNEDGTGKLLWSKMPTKGYLMADGCWVRSAKEQHIHGYLVDWLVPHWTDARYCDLGIKLRNPRTGEIDRRSTVDFIVGPKLLIEQEGLPKHQRAAERYHKKLRLKVEAAKAAGWEVILIPPDRRPDDWLYDLISESWAESSIEEAEALIPKLTKADLYTRHKMDSCADLRGHIKEAKERLSGEKSPRKKASLYFQKTDEHGNTITVRRTKPVLCLMADACKPEPEVEPALNLDALVDELL